MTDHKELIARKNTRNMLDVLRDALDGADRVVVEARNALGEMDAHYLHAPEILDALEAQAEQVAVVRAEGYAAGIEAAAHVCTGDEARPEKLSERKLWEMPLAAQFAHEKARLALLDADEIRAIHTADSLAVLDRVRAEAKQINAQNLCRALRQAGYLIPLERMELSIAAAIMENEDE